MVLVVVLIGIIVFSIVSNQNKKIHEIEKKLEQYSKNINQGVPYQAVSPAINIKPDISPAPTVASGIVNNTTINPPVIQPLEQKRESEQYKEESSGKILGRIGIGALVLGIGFFLKYAFDNNWIGPAGRIFIGVLIGIILISIGQYFRKKYEMFSEVMFGGGIVVLYLSFYAAHYFYNLIDPFTTGVLMVIVTGLTFVFSFINEDNKLAILAVVGGFMTPYIIGATGNNMVEVFSYITILNIGVLAVTIFKKWPELVALAIVGTAINFATWFVPFYKEAYLNTTVFFLIITFIIFFIASIYRIVMYKAKSMEVDYFLLVSSAFGFFAMFYYIMKPNHEPMLGFYTLILAGLYLIVSYIVNKQNSEDKTLNIFMPAMAVAFLSVAVPIQFSGATIAILWFIESCVLFLVASSMGNRGFQLMGICVYVLGIINFFGWNNSDALSPSFVPFMNKAFGILIVAVISAYFISYIYKRYGSVSVENQKDGIIAFVIIANIVTLYAFSTQIIFYYNSQNIILENSYRQQIKINSQYNNDNYNYRNSDRINLDKSTTSNKNKSNTTLSIFWAVYAAILTAIGFVKRSSNLRYLGLALFILTAVKIVVDVWSLGSLYRIISFIGLGVIALIASFVYSKYKDHLKVV